MTEQTLATLHPLHFADQHANRVSTSHGLHGSFYLNLPHVSRSPELSRAYQVGDPVRLIDWKAYARNDQLIVREERDEAMASVVVVVDGRDTMNWPTADIDKEAREHHVTKFSFAVRIALHLVHRHVRLGDRVRLVLLSDSFSEHAVSAMELRSPSHVLSLFEELEKNNFDVACLQSFLSPHNLFYSRTHLLFWISDCCTSEMPKEFLWRSQSTVLFHTLSFLECDTSWLRNRTCYFDESAGPKEFLGERLKRKNHYEEKIREWCLKIRNGMENNQGSYFLFTDRSTIRSYIATLDGV